MLVIMHHRDAALFTQRFFYIKTFRRFDIFQVDSPKSWLQRFNDLYKFFRIGLIDLDIKNVDVGKYLEEYTLSFHDRLTRFWSDISESQYRSSIADHRYQVPLGRVFINVFLIGGDLFTWLGYTGRIGEG